MAMNTETKNNNVTANNTNEAANAQQEQQMQLVNNNMPEQAQKPEKEKIGVKGWAKRIGIGLGAAAALAGTAVAAFKAGEHSATKNSTQTTVPVIPTDGGNSSDSAI